MTRSMLSNVLFLSLFLLQLAQLTSFYNGLRVINNCVAKPLYANPLFFGGKRLPVKESDKPKEAVVKADYSIDEEDGDDVNQLVKIHDEERLQKVIARAGLASRREAEKMVSFSAECPQLFY